MPSVPSPFHHVKPIAFDLEGGRALERPACGDCQDHAHDANVTNGNVIAT